MTILAHGDRPDPPAYLLDAQTHRLDVCFDEKSAFLPGLPAARPGPPPLRRPARGARSRHRGSQWVQDKRSRSSVSVSFRPCSRAVIHKLWHLEAMTGGNSDTHVRRDTQPQ
ncbi:hypothetical protein FAGKG844_310009 [Frankia sp. AgKG'84/4]